MTKWFEKAEWVRIKAKFRAAKPSVILHATIQAIMKHSFCDAFPETLWKDTTVPLIFYHVKGKRFDAFIKKGEFIDVEFFLCDKEAEKGEKFREHLIVRMGNEENCKYYQLVEAEPIEIRKQSNLLNETDTIETEGELCLRFHVPVPFKPEKNHQNTFLTKEKFIDLFLKRMRRFFGETVEYDNQNDSFEVNPAIWFYTEVCTHHKDDYFGQTIKGCAGQLYIRGKFPGLAPFLLLGQELHAGFSLSSSQGYYSIIKNQPFFDRFFPSEPEILKTIESCAQQFDGSIEHIVETVPGFLNYKQLASDITKELENKEYKPSPSKAFVIKKPFGTRIVEQFSFKENVVAKYVLSSIEKQIDKVFSDTSTGFRKGQSRNETFRKINEAIKDGYQFVIESDIADFFPSIETDRLEQIIFKFIPSFDLKTKKAISSIIRAPYILNGTLYERKKGVAQGSPVSPLFANLYLSEFDDYFAKKEILMIRYADDFIILLKDLSAAEELIGNSQEYLSKIGLSLKMEKTGIKKISEGFSFLGFNFNDTESTPLKNPIKETAYKKPLYICKPFCFPSLYGEAINIYQNRKIVESYPLRRVSEMIITENSMVSTALINRCSEMKIPLSLSLGTSYKGAAFVPEGKHFYDTVTLHRKRHEEISETEMLAIVRDIVTSKIAGYMTFFKERYSAGTAKNLEKLKEVCLKIEEANSIEEIRGHEGYASKICYGILKKFIKEEPFKFKTRDRVSPDRTNAMLNYGYSLLFSRIHLTIKALALNPFLGFLHSSQNRYESLVCDIQELFRARIDKAIVRMINLKIISENDFVETNQRMYLTTQGRKNFIENIEREMQRKPKKYASSMQEEIYIQCTILKQWVQRGESLLFYKWEESK
ncbi:MAG: CRISPR-associated endonuclease Cas1 [bacterium]